MQNNCNNYSGLYLFGKVIDRTRRHVPKDNSTTETVTYLVQSNRIYALNLQRFHRYLRLRACDR